MQAREGTLYMRRLRDLPVGYTRQCLTDNDLSYTYPLCLQPGLSLGQGFIIKINVP